jgi:hypothetical protein
LKSLFSTIILVSWFLCTTLHSFSYINRY